MVSLRFVSPGREVPLDNRCMPSKPQASPDSPLGTTPFGGLDEGGLRAIVGYQLAQATIATSHVFMAEVGAPFDLRPVEFTILSLVHENPDVSAARLAKALAVTPPNIKLWIDRLEGRGLVQRVPSAADRRAQPLRVTRLGKSLAQRSLQMVIERERAAFGALSMGEQTILIELLHKLARCRSASPDQPSRKALTRA